MVKMILHKFFHKKYSKENEPLHIFLVPLLLACNWFVYSKFGSMIIVLAIINHQIQNINLRGVAVGMDLTYAF